MQSFFCVLIFFDQNTENGNQTLKTLRPTICSTNHYHLKFYYFFSRFPPHTAKIEGGGKDCNGGGSQGKDRCVGVGGEVGMFEKDE